MLHFYWRPKTYQYSQCSSFFVCVLSIKVYLSITQCVLLLCTQIVVPRLKGIVRFLEKKKKAANLKKKKKKFDCSSHVLTACKQRPGPPEHLCLNGVYSSETEPLCKGQVHLNCVVHFKRVHALKSVLWWMCIFVCECVRTYIWVKRAIKTVQFYFFYFLRQYAQLLIIAFFFFFLFFSVYKSEKNATM